MLNRTINVFAALAIFSYQVNAIYDLLTFSKEWQASWPYRPAQYECQTAPGMADLGKTPGTEDVEINYDMNKAVVSIGLRFFMFESYAEMPAFQGLFIYDLAKPKSEPTKVPIAESNPHGISTYRLDKDLLRVFIVSHSMPQPTSKSKEEIIVVDYDFSTNAVVREQRIDSGFSSVNDVAALNRNSFAVSNDLQARNPSALVAQLNATAHQMSVRIINFDDSPKSTGYTNFTSSVDLDHKFKMPNGLVKSGTHLFVADWAAAQVVVFRSDSNGSFTGAKVVDIVDVSPLIPDNPSVTKNGDVILMGSSSGLYDPKTLTLNTTSGVNRAPIRITEQGTDKFGVSQVLMHDTAELCSVAAAFDGDNKIILGYVEAPLQFCEKATGQPEKMPKAVNTALLLFNMLFGVAQVVTAAVVGQ